MEINNNEFYRITNYVKQNFGVNLNQKRAFVEKRLEKILLDSNYTDFNDFMNYVEKNTADDINSIIISSLVTNYTYFLREQLHFELLKNVILPKIYKNGNKKKGINIWSAATSSGQEAYTILMLILEFLGDEYKEWYIYIIGTDVSQKMLNKAIQGKYKKEEVIELSEEWVKKYFTIKIDGEYEASNILKDRIEFKKVNLISEYNFNKMFQVIFLRNVLIYFESVLIDQIVDKVADHLEVGGYLFIGVTETVEIRSDKLICIQPSVYRKI